MRVSRMVFRKQLTNLFRFNSFSALIKVSCAFKKGIERSVFWYETLSKHSENISIENERSVLAAINCSNIK